MIVADYPLCPRRGFSVYVSNAVLTPGNNILCGGTFMSLHVSATVRVVLVSVGC